MTNDDKKAFSKMWRAAWENVGKNITADLLRISFAALKPYTIEQIAEALTQHIRDPMSGKYAPKPANIVEKIEGVPPDIDAILAAARLKTTPLGILAYNHISSWNLNNLSYYELKPIATECLQLLPLWKHRIQNQEYTKHELALLEKYQISDRKCLQLVSIINDPQNLRIGNVAKK